MNTDVVLIKKEGFIKLNLYAKNVKNRTNIMESKDTLLNYSVIGGKVRSHSLEINLTKHCNLSCAACSHRSPISKPENMPLDVLHDDLALLSKYMHVENVKVLGGRTTFTSTCL